MALTDTALRQAKPSEKPRRISDGKGLYIEISPSGGKLWRVKYRFDKKEKRLSLGVYPEVSLAQARKDCDAARELLAQGIDPGADKKDAKRKAAVAADDEFETVARAWHKVWSVTRSTKHAAQVIQRLEVDVFPTIGRMPVGRVTAPMLLDIARAVEKRGAHDLARRAYQNAGQVLRYAVANSMIQHNVAASVRVADVLKPRKVKHHARLPAHELPELLHRIDTYDGYPRTRLGLKLMAYTFLRTSELIGARWEEFDRRAGVWRVPKARMKMDTDHIVPMSTQAWQVLDAIKESGSGDEVLFPGERDHQSTMSNNTLLFALYRMGYRGRMTGHGFRGVASTILHEHGFDSDHIELQLAHEERDKTKAAYSFAAYLPQRKKMMQWWADEVDQLRARYQPA